MDVSGTGDEDRETVSGSNSCLNIKHGVPISTFDLSVENFLSSMEAISELCGGNKEETFEVSEIERFKSMVVFMREWKQFYFSEWMPSHCKSKTIDFAYVAEFAEVNHVINGINLPLFSSAAVPKQMDRSPCTESTPDNDDFVLQVGGSVWALDWCPRLRENTGCNVEIEYLAVAAHPPGSEYHKIGEQLSGRGSIQIWCFLHLGNNDEVHISSSARGRGRPKKASHSISSETIKPSNNMENPSAPFTIRGFGSSNDLGVPSEVNTNEVPKNSYKAGDLDCHNGTYPHVDNSIKGPRSRGRPIKTPVAKKVRPRGRPRKYPISNSNECEVICSDQLLVSFSSTSRDFRSLNGPIAPVGCFIDESHKGVNCVSDLNGQEKVLPICKSNPHSNVDGLDVPMNSPLPSGSHEIGSTASRPRRRHKKSSVPSENSIIPLSEDLLVLPISRGCEASRGSAVTGKDIEVRPLGGFNSGACDMKSDLQGKNRDVKDGATILYADTNQSMKINDGVAKGVCDGFSGDKLKTGKKNEFDCYRYFIPEPPHIKEVHDSGASVIPIHVDGSLEIAAVIKKSAPKEFFIPTGIALPRLVLSVAHNGKVAWDMKWRPTDFADSKRKHHLGYLAVLLGNGSLEVWEVPVHGIIRLLYATCHTEGTDPRFLKLQPVFRCSRVNFGGRQSIPLTLEWSPSASRDLILAGCHDGTVALWKFSSQLSFQDTKPLLCFTADTVPIRSLAWAPDESDTECSNIIVTAGHEGLKFWDLRDPYHPMWDFCPVQRAVLGLDWLKNPRCIVIAYEDGTLRTLSVTRAANDMPITGETLSKTKQQGVHFQSCSSFAIWSVQVSRSSGHVAYCSSDGWTRHFQLTEEAVNKDSSRYRKPHLVCGSFVEEGPTIRINTHFTSTPLPEQTFVSKVVNEATPINSSMLALCWQEDHTIKFNSRQKKRKGNPRRAAEAGEDEGTLQCIQDKGDESRLNIMKFPPKSVALHKVRWNMNKGSGRWLCYGGAAGIVRCQVVSSK